jgi:hypothetical protein
MIQRRDLAYWHEGVYSDVRSTVAHEPYRF